MIRRRVLMLTALAMLGWAGLIAATAVGVANFMVHGGAPGVSHVTVSCDQSEKYPYEEMWGQPNWDIRAR